MMPLLKDIRDVLDQYDQTYVVGETFMADTKRTANYCGDDKLHAAFNFKFAENRWHPKRFLTSLTEWYQSLSSDAWPNNFLSNHDMTRTASRYCFGEDDRRAKVAAAMLLTVKGTPFMYYGEEIGMRDIPIRKKSDVKDPIGKTFWPVFKGRDGCRAPMQWNDEEYSGFSKTEPWLPVHANFIERNVENQKADPDSILNFVKNIIRIRKNEPALQRGNFTPIITNPRHLLAFARAFGKDKILVVLNFSSRELTYQLPDGEWVSLFDNQTTESELLKINPYQVHILKLKD
jgi:alpha-glucosidase